MQIFVVSLYNLIEQEGRSTVSPINNKRKYYTYINHLKPSTLVSAGEVINQTALVEC